MTGDSYKRTGETPVSTPDLSDHTGGDIVRAEMRSVSTNRQRDVTPRADQETRTHRPIPSSISNLETARRSFPHHAQNVNSQSLQIARRTIFVAQLDVSHTSLRSFGNFF